MKTRIVLKATDLDGFLTENDRNNVNNMNSLYTEVLDVSKRISRDLSGHNLEDQLIQQFQVMGDFLQKISAGEKQIKVYTFETPRASHGEASRLIAKLRDPKTQNHEFIYYVQRAYELLFNLAYGSETLNRNYLIKKTPVTIPVQNYAVHKIPDIDKAIQNTVMCVMLRGALLPSMIMSKEIEEYSSTGYVTPFALFKISRDDSRKESDMEYILDLKRSFFSLENLHDKDLVFADPMNATGGSLVTIVKYLEEQGVKPRSIRFFNVISALKGTLRIIRAINNATIYTLWMDPVLNELAYILPGLGDAGDRLNGIDMHDSPRNIIQLIADYGSGISSLYRSQVREIENTVLGR